MASNEAYFLVLCSCVILSFWVWAGPNDLFLSKSLWGTWWNVTSKSLIQKPMTFFLLIASLWILFHSSPWWSRLLCCELPCWEAHKTWGWSLASNQQRNKTFSTTLEKPNPANNHMSELESESLPRWSFKWEHSHIDSLIIYLWETLKQTAQLNPARFLTHKRYNVYCFKSLRLVVILTYQ